MQVSDRDIAREFSHDDTYMRDHYGMALNRIEIAKGYIYVNVSAMTQSSKQRGAVVLMPHKDTLPSLLGGLDIPEQFRILRIDHALVHEKLQIESL